MITGSSGLGIWLYRLGLGWLLGHRFLLIKHRSCWTGERRATVLAVVEADAPLGRFIVAARKGNPADWLADIRRDPAVHVAVGVDAFAATARPIERTATATLVAVTRGAPVAGAALAQRVRSCLDPRLVRPGA